MPARGRSSHLTELAAGMHELDAGEQWSLQPAHEAMDASSQPELAVGALRPVELAASKARGRSSESASREVWRPTELAAREQGSATAGACSQQVGGARWSVSRGSTGTRGEGTGERGWRERGARQRCRGEAEG